MAKTGTKKKTKSEIRWLLKKVLKKYGITAYRFAKGMEISYSNVWRMLKEDFDPRLSTAVKAAKVIGCKLDELYGF